MLIVSKTRKEMVSQVSWKYCTSTVDNPIAFENKADNLNSRSNYIKNSFFK